MKKEYDAIVYIGRFQPFHNAHLEILNRADKLADKTIIVIGSSNQPRTYKNPFSDIERVKMIEAGTKRENPIITVRDSMYNNQAWAIRVQQGVAKKLGKKDYKIGIIGHEKDESSFYLKMFPQWEHIDVDLIETLHATEIRSLYFRKGANLNYIKSVVPNSIFGFLQEFKRTEEYNQIVREREFIDNYKKQYANVPYPPVFVASDAVVIQSGHILMIKRRAEPGKGLWALPGGFFDAINDKSMQDGMIRELKEETGIKVPIPVLVGNIKENRVFDAINRSARGRTITNAFKILLPDGELPKVKGMDDAEKAKWIPISELDSSMCFEDHFEIIQYFVGG